MSDDRPLSIVADCYAGYRDEQTPRAIVLAGRRIEVAEVIDQWLAPDHRCFKLQGTDGETCLVRHDVRSGEWELTMFRRGEPGPGASQGCRSAGQFRTTVTGDRLISGVLMRKR